MAPCPQGCQGGRLRQAIHTARPLEHPRRLTHCRAVINVERTISLVCRAITVRFGRKRALVSHDRCWPPPATNWPMTEASVPAVVRELLVEGRLDIRPVHTCRPVVVTSGRASSKLWAGRRTASSVGTHCHADDSALRRCHKSRGTRYSERHSAQSDAPRRSGRVLTLKGHSIN